MLFLIANTCRQPDIWKFACMVYPDLHPTTQALCVDNFVHSLKVAISGADPAQQCRLAPNPNFP